jgi:hypothetical protein
MSVDQELERLIGQTLEQTDRLLKRGEASWDVARKGVETVAADLEKRYPGEADWIAARIAEWLRRHAH